MRLRNRKAIALALAVTMVFTMNTFAFAEGITAEDSGELTADNSHIEVHDGIYYRVDNSDDTQHKWSSRLKKLIGTATKDRDEAIDRGESGFSREYIVQFLEKVDEYLAEGWSENNPDKNKYGAIFERSLRCVKSHMKISGQFESVETAENYAIIKSYIETCRRNKINEIVALKRLCEGNPYTVQEILSNAPPK